ncbi:Phosphoenolpyruvate-protein phosphotransferase [invertebrate metagenome]|uniref:Phosphoenolpyruvate-protein phosphotransferase n=1 Tax=invertebrate metagenome TaxID=1711999 RepID=A0A2H9T7L1_9ZZZZ
MDQSNNFYYTFPLKNGLHARPAQCIRTATQTFPHSITIKNLKNNKTAETDSVFSMIAADIQYNDKCLISSNDPDPEWLDTFHHFLKTDFLTCDDTPVNITENEQKPLPVMLRQAPPDFIRGTSVGSGISSGQCVVIQPDNTGWSSCHKIPQETPDQAHEKFDRGYRALIDTLTNQCLNTNNQSLSSDERNVIHAQLALLEDKQLILSITSAIKQGESAFHAIIKAQETCIHILEQASSAYIKERSLDIKDICSQLLISIYGKQCIAHHDYALKTESVLVCQSLTPSEFLAFDASLLKGLVIESVSTTSHTVILARSRGIPVMTGAKGALAFSASADPVILDAHNNLLIKHPSDNTLRFYAIEKETLARIKDRQSDYSQQPATTQDNHIVEVAANINDPLQVEDALSSGADGIGLFRTEMLYMDRESAPGEEEQFLVYHKVVTATDNKTTIIRTADIGGDKPIHYLPIDKEDNPFLGYRAIRLYPEFIDLFTTQLRAILRASAYGRCKIMVPMIATLDEAKWLREMFCNVCQQLDNENISYNRHIPLGMMLEVPSCAFIIDQLSNYMDFFSIGSNDLAQYFFAADRGNSKVKTLGNGMNPAFLRFLDTIVKAAHQSDKWIGLCGELASDLRALPLLTGLGLDEISVAPPMIPAMKEKLHDLSYQQCQQLVEQSLQQESPEQTHQLLYQFRNRAADQPILSEDTIMMHGECSSKPEILKALVDNLYVNQRITCPVIVEEAVWERESISPTMLGFGIAVPHCKSDAVLNNTISILKLKHPIQWNPGDDVKTGTIFLLTVKANDATNAHLRIFAKLARRIMQKPFREALSQCSAKDDVMVLMKDALAL